MVDDTSPDLPRLKRIVSDLLNVERNKITLDSHFENDLGADSLDVVEIVIMIEAEFDLEIDDELASTIQTVKQALSYIERQKKNKT